MPEYHNIFMALKTFDKLEISRVATLRFTCRAGGSYENHFKNACARYVNCAILLL
jgi:hypothetical protein